MPAAAAEICSCSPVTGFRGPFTSVNVLTSEQGVCPHCEILSGTALAEREMTRELYLTKGVQPRSPYASIAANENRVTPAAGSVHKYRSQRCAKVRCSQWARRVFRNGFDAGYAQRGRLVASEQPRGPFDVEHNCVTTSAGSVNADCFYVAQRAQDVGFE